MEKSQLDLVTPKPRDQRAFNAYRHGLTGHVLIPAPDDREAYTAHCRGILESLAPSGAFETDLTQSIADDRWRLKRAKATYPASGRKDHGPSYPDAGRPPRRPPPGCRRVRSPRSTRGQHGRNLPTTPRRPASLICFFLRPGYRFGHALSRLAEAKRYVAAPRKPGVQACSRVPSALSAPGGRTV